MRVCVCVLWFINNHDKQLGVLEMATQVLLKLLCAAGGDKLNIIYNTPFE